MDKPEIRYVICRNTGTILDLNDCYIVTDEQLGDASTDSEVCDVADSFGVSVELLAQQATTTESDNEQQALDHVVALARKFNWKGTLFTRQDVINAVIEAFGDRDEVDSRVKSVMDSPEWTEELESLIVREGMDYLNSIVYQLDIKVGNQ